MNQILRYGFYENYLDIYIAYFEIIVLFKYLVEICWKVLYKFFESLRTDCSWIKMAKWHSDYRNDRDWKLFMNVEKVDDAKICFII